MDKDNDMRADTDGEWRFLWKALNVLSAILLTATLAVTGWMLTQVIALKVQSARVAAGQTHMCERLERIEKHIDTAGQTAGRPHEH